MASLCACVFLIRGKTANSQHWNKSISQENIQKKVSRDSPTETNLTKPKKDFFFYVTNNVKTCQKSFVFQMTSLPVCKNSAATASPDHRTDDTTLGSSRFLQTRVVLNTLYISVRKGWSGETWMMSLRKRVKILSYICLHIRSKLLGFWTVRVLQG